MKLNLQKIIHIIDYLKSREYPLFDSTAFKTSILGLCAIILFIFSVPLVLDNSGLKFQIEQDVSKSLGANFTINSDIELSFFPSVTISGQHILLQNYNKGDKVINFYAQSADIDLSLFQLIGGKSSIKKITFSKAILENYHNSHKPNRNNSLTKVVDKILANHKPNISSNNISEPGMISQLQIDDLRPENLGKENSITFKIENGKVLSYDKSGNINEIENLFGTINMSQEEISANGEFISQDVLNKVKLIAQFNAKKTKKDSLLEITSSIANFRIRGIFSSGNNGILKSDFDGVVEGEIFKIKPFYKTYIGNSQAVFDKLKSGSNSIQISGKVKNKAGEAAIEDLVINSTIVTGSGRLDLNLTLPIPVIDIDLHLDHIDIDEIWSSDRINLANDPTKTGLLKKMNDETLETIARSQELKDSEDAIYPSGVDLTSEITIKKAHYLGGDIEDIDLYLTVSKKGEILVLPMMFKIPGQGLVRINGTLFEEHNSPKFIGKIDASGEKLHEVLNWMKLESENLKLDKLTDYILYSDIMLTPNVIALNNFYLNLDNDGSEFLGEIKIDNTDRVTSITNKFRISSFNADEYFLISGKNIYLSPGSLLKKTLWLNEINSHHKIDLEFDKLTYKGEDFFNQSLKLLYGQGYFEISDLTLRSDVTDLSANLKVDISKDDPHFEMQVIANSFQYESLKNSALFGLKNKDITAADQFFSLPSLEGFNGNISLSFKDLHLSGTKIEEATMNGELQDGLMRDAVVNCKLYGGDLSYTGLIGLKYYKTISGAVSLNKVQLGELLPILVKINNVDGIANIAARIASAAANSKEFIERFSAKAEFKAQGLTVKQYGLDELIRKMFFLKAFKQDLLYPEDILTNPEHSTRVRSASGSVTFDKVLGDKFKIDFSGTAFNGILSGKANFVSEKIEGLTNIIFLTGTRENKTPIHIATSLKGTFGNISYASNIDQVRQRLGLKVIANASSQSITSDNQRINENQDVKKTMEQRKSLIQDQKQRNPFQ